VGEGNPKNEEPGTSSSSGILIIAVRRARERGKN
jgi:hypothetical protein